MDKCTKTAAVYLATLKCIYTLAQENHWRAKGSNFYSNHLMFQRIYEETLKDVDSSAEKFVNFFGEEVVDTKNQNILESKIKSKYQNLEGVEQQIKIIEDFIKFSKFAYDCFEQEGKKSHGMDDMMMNIVNNQEGHLYLLGQSNKN